MVTIKTLARFLMRGRGGSDARQLTAARYAITRRSGYATPIWQVVSKATGGVVTTHSTREEALRAARRMNGG